MIRLSLIIPCYNEAENLYNLITKINDAFSNYKDIEVILVNNGSTDNTAEILHTVLPKYSFIKTINIDQNQGYGYGILQGLKKATGKYLGWMHADLQTEPKEICKIYDTIDQKNKSCFIKGYRHGRNIFDLLFTMGMSVFCSIAFGKNLKDINAQPNIFPRNFYEQWINPPKDFSLDLYAYIKAKQYNLNIIRFPVFFGKRMAGEAHLNNLLAKIKYAIRTITYSLKLRSNV